MNVTDASLGGYWAPRLSSGVVAYCDGLVGAIRGAQLGSGTCQELVLMG